MNSQKVVNPSKHYLDGVKLESLEDRIFRKSGQVKSLRPERKIQSLSRRFFVTNSGFRDSA